MLEIESLVVGYGDVGVLWDCSLTIGRGEVVTLLGANGAGKTTLMRAISRLIDAKSGRMLLDGVDITRLPSKRVVAAGIAHVPEGRKLFPEMTVEDNLLMGAYPERARASMHATLAEVFDLFPRVRERRKQIAGTLSGGEQQMVAIGRGLMSKPELLMLDEPSLGLAPAIVEQIFFGVRDLARSEGLGVLLLEQNVVQALKIVDRAYVMRSGRVILEETVEQMKARDSYWDLF